MAEPTNPTEPLTVRDVLKNTLNTSLEDILKAQVKAEVKAQLETAIANLQTGLTEADITALVNSFAPAVRNYVGPLAARIAKLEQHVFPTRGKFQIWDERDLYNGGDTVVHDGHRWRCLQSNAGLQPGLSPMIWHQLGNQ
jgi:hypothetical protein